MLLRKFAWSLFAALVRTQATGDATDQVDTCWRQWNDFWSANGSLSYSSTLLRAPPTTTTFLTARTKYSMYETEYTTTSTNTRLKLLGPAGDPNDQTQTLISTIVSTFDGSVSTAVSTGSSYTTTETEVNTASYISVATIRPNATTPTCTLPSQYAPCQSQWDAWAGADVRANGIEQPLCTQANVTGSTCQHVISNHYSGVGVFGATGIPGWITSGDSTFWPTSQTFAPGCTLGCQQCAIMGDKVRILYWPARTAIAVENGTATAKIAHETRASGSGSDIRTTVFEGNTLTSPTIYISYKTLYASDSCTGVGKTFSNTIIPLTNSQDLHSLAYKALGDHGAGPGLNGIQYLSWEYEERPFNFTDLEEPIPDEVYNQLPYCQMDYRGFTLNGMQDSMTFSCTRQGPYNPVIAVPPEVRNLDPAWKTCTGWYAGLYDPPKALQGATAAATPTTPNAPASASAEPAGSVSRDGPRPTSDPGEAGNGEFTGAGGAHPTSAVAEPAGSATQAAPKHTADPSQTEDGDDGVEEGAGGASPTGTNVGDMIISVLYGNGGAAGEATASTLQGGSPNQTAQQLSREDQTLHDNSGGSKTVGGSAQSAGSLPYNSPETGGRREPTNNMHSSPRRHGTGTNTYEPDTVAPTTFHANGNPHTLSIVSHDPIVDGQTLTPGQMTTLGTRTIAVESSAIYINSQVWVSMGPKSTTITTFSPSPTGPGHTFPFSIYDTILSTNYVYDAHTVFGHPDEIVVGDFTLTAGQSGTILDWWQVSLRTDGSIVTASFESEPTRTPTTTSEVTTGSTPSEYVYPTSAVLLTPSGASSGGVSTGAESRGSRVGGRMEVWTMFGSAAAVVAVLCT